MVVLYVKGRGERAPCVEVTVERAEGMPVEDLLVTVAEKTNLAKEELHLMYGGCILKTGKTLDLYHIKDGCTLHIMKRKKKVKYTPLPIGPEGMTVVFSSPNIQQEVAPFINKPDLVAKMIPLVNPDDVREVLKDPNLLTKMSDMRRINHHIHKNYLLFPVMQALLRLHRIKYNMRDSGIRDRLTMEVGQVLEMVSGGVEVGGEMGGATAEADEHLMVPSRASTSHPANPQTHGTILPRSSSTSPAGTIPPPSFTVSTADLASALANIATDQATSQPTSLSSSAMASQESSQPSSLQLTHPQHTGSSAPPSLQVPELPPRPALVNRSLSDSGYGNTGTGQGTSISQAALQQALNLAMSHVQQQLSSSQPLPTADVTSSHQHPPSHRPPPSHHSPPPHYSHDPPPLPPRRQLSLREEYLPHLEQLHAMGITYSDVECLHALEAAQGDLQTALEILMGPGN